MSNRLMLRAIQLWLFIFLSWFVCCVNPVTQEDIILDVSREKSSIDVAQLKPTPQLASLSQTETKTTDNIDVNSLIVSPSIAPATPWEDTKVSSSLFHAIHDEESTRQASSGELSQKEEMPIKTLDGQIQSEGKTEQFAKKANIGKNEDSGEDAVDGFQPKGSSNEERSSESSFVPNGNDNDGLSEKDSENKQDDMSQTKVNMDNKEDLTKHNLKPSEEKKFNPEETVARYAEDPQVAEGDEDLVGARDDPESPREDMPSFKEWSKKFLAEEEQKNKVQQNIEKGNSEAIALKVKSDRKQNNYASVDCGANILEKNAKAQNAESILLENKDFYMLNPCSANIWFIVELCDHVQVTSLQLANFELFSSTIEKFQVSFSTRYPTREWEQVQTFTARSEKAVQTFKLEPIFAKYMRVEQLSYHGSEHYCPWSLLRVYGNSMVEAYEEHESSQEGGSTVDDDDAASSNVVENKEEFSGILKTATDAVLQFVKETAKKLVKIETTGDSSNVSANSTNSTKYTGSPQQAIDSETPKAIVQLMDREDFEASCHEGSDEVLNGDKCLPGTFCSSMGSSAASYQNEMFFEIVYNVCRQDVRNAQTCFNTLTKNISLNKSAAAPAFKSKSNAEEVVSDKEDTVKKNEMVKNGFQKEGDHSEEHSDKHTEVEITENTDKTAAKQDPTLDTVSFSQSSSTLRSSEAVSSENTPVTPVILPSSSSSRSVTTDTVTPDNTNHASSPTPLAQPPLAVQQLPDTKEPPTEPALTNTEGHEGNNENPVVKSNDVHSDSSEATTTTGSDVQLSATKHITPNHVTTATISAESIASVSQDRSISSMADSIAPIDGGEANQESHYQDSRGDDGEKLMLESMKGTKEEDLANPHVDVLKITLTDAETKEGKAEPEHVAPNDFDKSKSEKNETLKDGTMIDREVPNEPTSQVDSGSSSLKENSKTLDIDHGSESKENDVLGNDMNEKSGDVKITSNKESESEHNEQHITTQKENEKIEEEQDNDITTQEISSNVDEKTGITEQSDRSKDSETNSEKCDAKEYEVETYEEGTKHARKNMQAALDNLGAAEPEPGPAILVGNGQMNNKKESIFVAMSRKIKALEQNVTITNLFLEELSQRYRKSIDEMQKKMEKKLSGMSKNSKFLTQVNLYQNTTILALTSRLQNVERELSVATSRLKVINQEVVERHVLGMCIQFVIVLLLWYFGRNRAPSIPNTQSGKNVDVKTDVLKSTIPAIEGKVGNDHTKHSSVEDIRCDSTRNCLEEFTLSKSSNGETSGEGKRRRRRRNRVSSVNSDEFLEHESNQGQSIVTKTAGLLFHTPGCHEDAVKSVTENAAQRSCSADSLNGIAHTKDERKVNTKKSAASPKTKKVCFRNSGKKEYGTTKLSSDLFNSDFGKSESTKNATSQRGLVRSKSVEDYGNGVHLYNNDLSSDAKRKLSPSRCSLQSDSCDQLNNQKSRWIWGFG